jgi:hypothetical protein
MIRPTTLAALRLAPTSLLVALASALAWSQTGCSGTPPGEFIIVQNQVPNPDCTIPAVLGSLYRGEGVLDVRLLGDGPTGYQFFPLLQNNFPGPSAGQTVDANRIALSGFDIDVTLPVDAPPDSSITALFGQLATSSMTGGPDPLIEYSTLTSGSVASGGGDTASSVNVFPGDLAHKIRDLGVLSPVNHFWVMASVRARGDTLVNSVESDAFKYPIELCDGCLMLDQGTCPAATLDGNSCYVGQDSGTGCCTQGGSLFCPSLVATK